MPGRLIIDGNAVYEIDEECMEYMNGRRGRRPQTGQKETMAGQNRTGKKSAGRGGAV